MLLIKKLVVISIILKKDEQDYFWSFDSCRPLGRAISLPQHQLEPPNPERN